MKKDIQEFREKNGNVTYTIKELLFGVNAKLDRIEARLVTGGNKIEANRVGIESNALKIQNILTYGLTSILSLFGAIGGAIWLLLTK